jgi:hypothetical protein
MKRADLSTEGLDFRCDGFFVETGSAWARWRGCGPGGPGGGFPSEWAVLGRRRAGVAAWPLGFEHRTASAKISSFHEICSLFENLHKS